MQFLRALGLLVLTVAAIASGQVGSAPLRLAPFTHTNFKECPTASVASQTGREALTTQCL